MLGRANALNEAARMVNRGGRICLAAFPAEPVPVDLAYLVRNNIYVFGIRGEGRSATHRAAALMAQKRFDAKIIHTHTFPLAEVPTAIRYARERIEDAIKVVVQIRRLSRPQSPPLLVSGHPRREAPDLQRKRLIAPGKPGLFVEPDILHAPAVEEAVDHDRQPLDLRLPAGREAVVEEDRPSAILLQFLVDVPHQMAALFLVGSIDCWSNSLSISGLQ